jgi:dTMP kinase
MDQGKLVVMDAIDGAGKSTAIRAVTAWLADRGLMSFDLVAFMQQQHRLPEVEEIGEAGVLLSAEPTHCWIGSAIREEIIKSHPTRVYDGLTAAQAFALDRQVLFSRVVLPFLRAKPGRWVIQDRGLISSLAYQPLQDARITIEWLLGLEGNRLELSRPPELLLLLRLTPDEAMRRLEGRGEKVDEHVFENLSFQEKLAARYRDPDVLRPYREAGTRIVEIDAAQSPEAVGRSVCAELEALA